MDYEAAVHDMLSIGAGLTSREWVDARGAHNDLACAFVFLVVCAKPAATLVLPSSLGPPSTVGKEPESTTAPAPSRGRGTNRVMRRRLGHDASVRLQRRARCSRRRGWGCTFKPGTEPTTTATLRRCRGKKGRQGGKRCQRWAATRCRAPGSRRADLHTCEPTCALQ